jgi:LemA protein
MERANAKITSAFTLAVEAYPQVRSTEAYLKFQDELTGTENRISTARSDFNASVRGYNIAVRTFPGNLVAGFGGFKTKEEFKAAEGTDKAPDYDKAWDKGKE